jgi:2-iminobutanoate/2-iminopropanoate deaminase
MDASQDQTDVDSFAPGVCDACLQAAGATWADVVKTNTFVTDYQAFSQCSDVRMRYFGVASPTSTTIQIGGLAQPEAMVEIEMIAVVE